MDQITNLQPRRVGSVQLHQQLNEIAPGFQAMLQDLGFFPIGLSGVDLVQSMETVFLNWVAPTIAGSFFIYSFEFNIIQDSMYLLDNLNQVKPTVADVFGYFGTDGCIRAYSNPPDNPVANASSCVLWIEVTQNYCNAPVTGTLHNYGFSWSNTSQLVENDYATLYQQYCNGATLLTPVTSVLRSINDFVNFTQSIGSLTSTYGTNLVYGYYSLRTPLLGFIEIAPATFTMSWTQMITASSTGVPGQTALLLLILQSYVTSYQTALSEVKIKDVLMYGAMPTGGLSNTENSAYNIPGMFQGINATSAQAYAAAEFLKCTTYSYTEMSNQVQQVYAFELLSVTDEITVNVTCPPCTGSSCYPVGVSNITQNIRSYNSMPYIAPITGVYVGDLTQAQNTGIIDAAPWRLPIDNSALGRKNAYTYYLMPPGTTQTLPVGEFQTLYGNVYNPLDAAANMGEVTFNAVMDNDGYPQCDIPGGVLTATPSNASYDEHGCKSPFFWAGNITIPNSIRVSSTNVPAQCAFSSAIPLYQNVFNTNTYLFSSVAALHFNTSNTFTVWFQSSTVVTSTSLAGSMEVLLSAKATNYMHYIVDSVGRAAILIQTLPLTGSSPNYFANLFDTRNCLITQNLRDGILHQIAFKMTILSASPSYPIFNLELFIDGVSHKNCSNQVGSLPAPVAITSAFYYNALNTYPAETADANTGISNADTITVGVVYPQVLNATNIQSLYACQQSWQGDRCQSPILPKIVPAFQNVSLTGTYTCLSTPYLIYKNNWAQTYYPQSVGFNVQNIAGTAAPTTLFAANFWSLAFWVRIPFTSTTNPDPFADLIQINQGVTTLRVWFDTSVGNLLLKVVMNNVVTVPLNVYDGNAHFVTILYSNTTNPGSLSVYLDGQLAQPASSVTPRVPIFLWKSIY